MNIRKKGILTIFLIFGVLFSWLFYQIDWVPLSAKFEIKQMLQSHDTRQMRQVAADKKTQTFFIAIKKGCSLQRCDRFSRWDKQCWLLWSGN